MKNDKNSKPEDDLIPTDNFSSWLHQTRQAILTGGETQVPCGDCKACCTSSYFIHIKSHETQTRSSIPKNLLFPAPGRSDGTVVMGFEKNGRCPMFINETCSIYHTRPGTCRNYDCRIFTAADLSEHVDKALIAGQARRWKFEFSGQQDLNNFNAVKNAARFIREHLKDFPPGFVPDNVTQQAILAIKVYGVFINLNGNEDNNTIIEKIIAKYKQFHS